MENASKASFPHALYVFHYQRDTDHPRSLHLTSLASCFRSSVACAAAPAVSPASERILEFSSDLTDVSQAAVLPRTQLEMRTSNENDFDQK